MNARIVVSLGWLLAAGAGPAAAQQPAPPPVRPLGAVVAVSHDTLSSVAAAVQVAGGRVYVNDITAHRILLYDSSLAHAEVIADSAGEASNSYGAMPGTLLPFHADSALFITPSSLSMLVLSPAGAIARVMAMPPSGRGWPPAGVLIGNIFGTPGFDAHSRLVYFSPVRMEFRGRSPLGDGGPMTLEPPDSAYLVRFDFTSRTLDTAGVFHIPRSRSSVSRDDQGRMHMVLTAIPPQPIDDWAVTSDGRVAVVRGRDYHVDWLGADGTWTATPRMPFAWEHLDDDQKAALVDSIAAALQVQLDSMPARMQRAGIATSTGPQGGSRESGPGGGGSMTVIIAAPGGGDRPPAGGPGGPGGGPARVTIAAPTAVKAAVADVPDYRPPFRQGAVRADLDGNLWIRTSKVENGQPVYDVVNGRGELVDRVQLPPYRTIAGFGPGVIYMGVQDSTGTTHLERARVR